MHYTYRGSSLNSTLLRVADGHFFHFFSSDKKSQADTQADSTDSKEQNNVNIAILPLRDAVLFPWVVLPISMMRPRSLKLFEDIRPDTERIGIITRKDKHNHDTDPKPEDLCAVGTVARVVKTTELPGGAATLVVQGVRRFVIEKITQTEPYLRADIQYLLDEPIADDHPDREQFNLLVASVKDLGVKIVQGLPVFSPELAVFIKSTDNAEFIVNFIAGNIVQSVEDKQTILETPDLLERAKILLQTLQKEITFIELKNKVTRKTRKEIDRQQKEYFLQQQIKSIQEELGTRSDTSEEIAAMRVKAAKKKWPAEAKELFENGLKRLESMSASRQDYGVEYAHLTLLLDLPWNTYSTDKHDIKRAEKILDDEHFGMQKIKEQIVEHVAVLSLKKNVKAPVLCLVGPPGIGKTSLARSVANVLGRQFVKISLGGLHDEAELRGHRKAYVAAMPGRVIQAMKKARVSNPVILLDEIDKVGRDFRSDVQHALLEILDPEQNKAFYDNYLEVEYDLSRVLFIATANDISTLQAPLRDRLEFVYLSGYITQEKVAIAQKHLLPKQIRNHGMKEKNFVMSDESLTFLVDNYTHESGVRGLERLLARLIRYVAKTYVVEKVPSPPIDEALIKKVLGKTRLHFDRLAKIRLPGVAVGLAWTSVGGEVLCIEAVKTKEKTSTLKLTGSLGDVMKESAALAMSYLRTHADQWGMDVEELSKQFVHIHVPEGAIPKDGPSAGITLLVALCSLFSGQLPKENLAMTAEITLSGMLLGVGGIKEKILAAKRADMKEILLCADNEKDVEEISQEYLNGLTFHYAKTVEEALPVVFPSLAKYASRPTPTPRKKRAK